MRLGSVCVGGAPDLLHRLLNSDQKCTAYYIILVDKSLTTTSKHENFSPCNLILWSIATFRSTFVTYCYILHKFQRGSSDKILVLIKQGKHIGESQVPQFSVRRPNGQVQHLQLLVRFCKLHFQAQQAQKASAIITCQTSHIELIRHKKESFN